MVDYDAAEIAAVVQEVAARIGLGDHDITIEVDERTPMSRVQLTSVDPIHIAVEGGALEDLRRIRQLSTNRTADALGLFLFQAHDRLDTGFDAPPLGTELPLAHRVAWEVYSAGRLARTGHPSQRQRRLYHFRNRHGFTDEADAAFARLWDADRLTWAQVVAISDGATTAAPA